MTQLSTQQYADLFSDSYNDRQVTKENRPLEINGHKYNVLAFHYNPKTGYQGTVYQDVRTNEIIAAHRETESPAKDPFDAKTDIKPVLERINMQISHHACLKPFRQA